MKITSTRAFHYMLVRTIHGKLESTGAVSEHDLLPLYSILSNYPINVGIITIFGIRKQTLDPGIAIFVGGIITKILKNLHLWPSSNIPQELCADPIPLPRTPFSQWGIPLIVDLKTDVEASGAEMPQVSASTFSKGNLTRLKGAVAELKIQVQEIKTDQLELQENQRV